MNNHMVLGLFFVFLFFGCTLERDNPYDPNGTNYNPSLYPSSSSSLSSSLLAEVSSSSGISDDSSSSSGDESSSSSLPPVMVFCQFSDGSCPLTPISQETCDIFGGTPVQSCAESSSSAPSSSSSFVGYAGSYGSLYYEGLTYKTVIIGTQTWMAENLDYVVEGSQCYDNDPAKCSTYGSLYNWSTAMALPSLCNYTLCSSQIQLPVRGICPSGWHIPSLAEWETLSSYVESNSGCSYCDAKLLKSTTGWDSYNGASGNGTDQYGFSALPGGEYSNTSFNSVGNRGSWWSANELNGGSKRNMDNSSGQVNGLGWIGKSYLRSVRCVQD
jgi:uncharacterized protein (TIGR02145 family)